MTDSTDYDFALALQLYEDLNGVKYSAPAADYAISSDSEEDNNNIRVKSEFPQISVKQESQGEAMSTFTPSNASTSTVVTFENQQAITVSLIIGNNLQFSSNTYT